MNLNVLYLRAFGTIFGMQGNQQAAQFFERVASAVESGQRIDDHMATVNDALKAGTLPDFDDLRARIEAEGNELQGGQPE